MEGEPPTDEQWGKIKERVTALFELCKETGIDLTSIPYDEEKDGVDPFLYPPRVGNHELWFNGVGEESHETMFVERKLGGFNFCKTARKPYDYAVVQTLIIIQEECPGWLELGSDGGDEVFEAKAFDKTEEYKKRTNGQRVESSGA